MKPDIDALVHSKQHQSSLENIQTIIIILIIKIKITIAPIQF